MTWNQLEVCNQVVSHRPLLEVPIGKKLTWILPKQFDIAKDVQFCQFHIYIYIYKLIICRLIRATFSDLQLPEFDSQSVIL